VETSAWVKINDCSIEYKVFAELVEFRIGGHLDGFDLVATERGLASLVSASVAALEEMRAGHRVAELAAN
jgi:hypothetical protein